MLQVPLAWGLKFVLRLGVGRSKRGGWRQCVSCDCDGVKVVKESKSRKRQASSTRRGRRGDTVLSTKDAARICQVALSTIVYWFDKGLIKGYKTPGGHRRIFLKDLHEFMESHGIPITGRLPDEKYRVLVVDDQRDIIEFFHRVIGGYDGRVEMASAMNGFQAGRLLTTFRPDLVFLDIVMPTLDGFEVCKLIRDDNDLRSIDIIAVTGHGSPDNVAKIVEAGASMVLRKPVRLDEVHQILDDRIGGGRSIETI